MTYNKMIKNKVERDGYDSRDLSSQSVSETPMGAVMSASRTFR